MKRLVDLVKLDRLDNLVRKQATGTPDELAGKLKISRSNLFEFISFLRDEMFAPIRFSKEKGSYVYAYTPKFYLGFEKDRLHKPEMYAAFGGNREEENPGDKVKNNEDNEDFVFDEDTLMTGFFQDDFY